MASSASSTRRTARLDCIVHHLCLALGGRPAASFARRLTLPVSKGTLLRVVRRRARTPTDRLNVVGIDDSCRLRRRGNRLWRAKPCNRSCVVVPRSGSPNQETSARQKQKTPPTALGPIIVRPRDRFVQNESLASLIGPRILEPFRQSPAVEQPRSTLRAKSYSGWSEAY